ncbi:MAG: chemotaxis protein CheW [Desulfobulbaceae bacterium]|nr:chemotaxis protein CheW [Desulfobulbaceae bacterium]
MANDILQKKSEGKYLTFNLGKEQYGLPIIKVKEIIGMMEITSMPQYKEHFKGVINLRDKVIPVIDMRLLFGMPETEATDRTCIIVVEIERNGKVFLCGIIVDSVSDVRNFNGEQIEDAPEIGSSASNKFILGIAKQDGEVKILLDIDQIIVEEDLEMLRKAI